MTENTLIDRKAELATASVQRNKSKTGFLRDRSGNFAGATALALFPLFAGVGLAIDYSNLTRENSQLQNAVDSAVLMAGSYYYEHNQLPPVGEVGRYLAVNGFETAEVLSYELKNEEIYLTAKLFTETLIFDMFDDEGSYHTASATVPIAPDSNVEIALVLDTTRSMREEGRLDALKVAASDFVDDALALAPPSEPDVVQVAVVPFSNYVNVGMANRNASWLDVDADEHTTTCRMRTEVVAKYGCRMGEVVIPGRMVPERCTPDFYRDGVFVAGSCEPEHWRPERTEQRETCDRYEEAEREVCNTDSIVWSGCVGSRAYPLHLEDHSYGTRVPGLMNQGCASPIIPLTGNGSSLKSSIRGFVGHHETFVGTGVSWGQRVLSPARPFIEGRAYGAETRKIMVVMSDGDSTISPGTDGAYQRHTNRDKTAAKNLTIEACADAKEQGIRVITIALGTTFSVEGEEALRRCASSAADFFHAEAAADLGKAFDDVFSAIFTLRLTS
ncbi:MAG: pilus assembly protein TadG-related protein [Pseudomonadota bacterium]